MSQPFAPRAAAGVAVDRRAFLQSAAAMAAAGTLLASGSEGARTAMAAEPKQADLASGAIDAHVHVWTPDLKAYPLAPGYKQEDMRPPSFTPEQLLEHARPCGVSRIVLIQMSFYGYDNRYMLDTMRRFPGVFSGVAVIDEEDQPAETMRKLKEQGVRGFRIRPGKRSPETWLTGEGMKAMWKCGAEEGLALCPLIDPNAIFSVEHMCRRNQDTPVVIDHFARIGVDGQINSRKLKDLCEVARYKHAHVKVSAFYALGKKQPPYADLLPMIRQLLDAYGPERLMWATDCPYQVQGEHTYEASIALVRDRLELSDGDRDWLLRKTAEKVFFQ